jgi:hypothetical protein
MGGNVPAELKINSPITTRMAAAEIERSTMSQLRVLFVMRCGRLGGIAIGVNNSSHNCPVKFFLTAISF